MSLEMLWF